MRPVGSEGSCVPGRSLLCASWPGEVARRDARGEQAAEYNATPRDGGGRTVRVRRLPEAPGGRHMVEISREGVENFIRGR